MSKGISQAPKPVVNKIVITSSINFWLKFIDSHLSEYHKRAFGYSFNADYMEHSQIIYTSLYHHNAIPYELIEPEPTHG
jgi:hypothetical protein